MNESAACANFELAPDHKPLPCSLHARIPSRLDAPSNSKVDRSFQNFDPVAVQRLRGSAVTDLSGYPFDFRQTTTQKNQGNEFYKQTAPSALKRGERGASRLSAGSDNEQ